MPAKAATEVHAASEELQQRAAALCRLQAASEDWWDGIEVNVPWAAVGPAFSKRADAWLGIISDVLKEDNALDSIFTIEDPDDPDDAVAITGSQLAGLEGFGKHDSRIECAEIDAEVEAYLQPVAQPAAARGRPKGSKNKQKAGAHGAAARAEAGADAEADGIDPLGGLCDELDCEQAEAKSKLKQGWTYAEYTGDLPNPRLQPQRIWGGITHPRLRRRACDAADGTLPVIATADATFPPAAYEWMHRQLITYSLDDAHLGGDRQPFDWMRRTAQPMPSLAELIAWHATTKIMILARCPVLREYWDTVYNGH